MIFSIFLLAYASALDSHGMHAPFDAVTLYFKERMLTKSAIPIPQLVCKNTAPNDGCALRRIVFVECHRNADEDWDAWACQGHGDEHDHDAPAGLELHALDIRCSGDSVDTCSLVYTLQFNAQTVTLNAHKKLVKDCRHLYDVAEEPFANIASYNLFAYGLTGFLTGVIIGGLVSFAVMVGQEVRFIGKGLKSRMISKRRGEPDPAWVKDMEKEVEMEEAKCDK